MQITGRKCILACAIGALLSSIAVAETELTLRKDFITRYRNRVTITADVTPKFFSRVHKRGKTGGDDGDIHISVLPNDDIGLATVIEIQNARDATAVIDRLKAARDAGAAVKVTGFWRIWAEHGGDHVQSQGAPIPAYEHSNPDHLFEIHSVTAVGDTSLLSTLVPIEGFTAPDNRAEDAFQKYEKLKSEITPFRQKKTKGKKAGDYVRLRFDAIGYNYVKFRMRLLDKRGYEQAKGQWRQPEDGMFVFAEIYEPEDDDEPLVRKRRLAFVKDSAPHNKVRDMPIGHCMLVLGIPRLNLELVAWRLGLGVSKPQSPKVLAWNLPYEMMIVAVYDDAPEPCGPGTD